MSTPSLSKSKLTSAHRCMRKMWLGLHEPKSAYLSSKALLAIGNGEAVGEVAKKIYATEESVEVPLSRDRAEMVRKTEELLSQGTRSPIFEATFEHENVLVRVDVLLPEEDGWRAIEIKGSTKKKSDYDLDCAIQWWVMKGAGLNVSSISLGHVNNQFAYGGDGNYEGLITEVDVMDAVLKLQPEIPELLDEARGVATGAKPSIPLGKHCTREPVCEFFNVCWPTDEAYPVQGLGGSKANHAEWINRGITDMRGVPGEEITEESPLRVHRITCDDQVELLPGAKEELEKHGYPRYHLDFESIGPAVPVWQGSKPYKAVPIQYSIHIDDGTGDGSLESMRHKEFLDLSGEPPMRKLAEQMIEDLGDSGPVYMYTDYEQRMINTLIELYPDLTTELEAIKKRLVDLAAIVKDHYYHPCMLGSWSVKAVAPAMLPHMSYANLEGINEGTAASNGYLEAIDPNTTPERKAELEEQLLRYCRFDTEAMVEIARFLLRD